MNMYNNLPQTTPAYYYAPTQYPRQMTMQNQEPQTSTSAPLYSTAPMLQQNYIKGRPVVSIDEARASQIDLDGSLYVFPDLGNKKIYTKQINMDGTASFNVFEIATPVESAPAPVYVTKDELDEILASFKASLVQEKPQEAGPAPKIKPQTATSFNL